MDLYTAGLVVLSSLVGCVISWCFEHRRLKRAKQVAFQDGIELGLMLGHTRQDMTGQIEHSDHGVAHIKFRPSELTEGDKRHGADLVISLNEAKDERPVG